MSLIISISGIRGTIGGVPGTGLTPVDAVKFGSAYGTWIKTRSRKDRPSVVIGRDARISGPMVEKLIEGTLMALGIDIHSLGLASTPSVEIAVPLTGADGGIIITASHNPMEWNALKLLNENGEFLSAEDGEALMEIIEYGEVHYSEIKNLGSVKPFHKIEVEHINQVLRLDLVDKEAIRSANFKVVVDCVNSVGGIIIPKLLKELGVEQVKGLYTEPTGIFPHNPEPLPENLSEISGMVRKEKADIGFVVDPDVDRLAIVCEDGSMFGEEYTLVAISDYVLSNTPGPTVSNLSSTRALKDISDWYKVGYFPAAVGEVNVVTRMKEVNAVIGGEGNGGVIYPGFHYGRDAVAGIALFLTFLAKSGLKTSELRRRYPDYFISKNKIDLDPVVNDIEKVMDDFKAHYPNMEVNTEDGIKVDMEEGWVQLRKSNTEPIIRLYAEGKSKKDAERIAGDAMKILRKLIV
ncbi:MAG: phosphoglucosamine mutase [Bacteroidales bacterium]|nr:phosphoglucosamine mutase [Bacteroidales bacterium]